MTNETTASQPTDFRKILVEVRESLQFANDSPNGGIDDTIWMMHRSAPETVFDFIDAALDGDPSTPQKTADLFASQPKSIGDDAQFCDLLKEFDYACRADKRVMPNPVEGAAEALVAYIDSRAPAAQASATIQAAPEGEAYGNKIAKVIWEIRRAKSLAWRDSLVEELIELIEPSPGPATIQEPVMVAEPVGVAKPYSCETGQIDEALANFLAEHTRLNQDGIDTHAMNMTLALNYAAINPTPESDIAEWREQGYLLEAAPMVADPASVVVAYVNGDELDNMLDDRTATIQSNSSSWRAVPLFRSAATVKAVPSEARIANLEAALRYYADGNHFMLSDPDAWETVSGEPFNFQCDEAGTAMVEDGSIAKMVLAGEPMTKDDEEISVTVPKSEGADAAPLADKTGGGE